MMQIRWMCLYFTLALVAADSVATAGDVELVSVRKIWDQGKHNAFTDLIRFQDKWFCSFREGLGHIGGDGAMRVLESKDGETWTSTALLTEQGIDLRDPKLSITPDGRLMIVAGGSVYKPDNTFVSRQPRVAFSADGHTWTPTKRVLGDGEWLWRVIWHEGQAYGVSYLPIRHPDNRRESTLTLVTSSDGVDWKLVHKFDIPKFDYPGETTLRFLPSGEAIVLVRELAGGKIGVSKQPFDKWTWHPTRGKIGGPNFIQLPDGSLWASGRDYSSGKAMTALAKMTPTSYEPVLTLLSGGDNSYAGMVWHNGLLWMSYYSSHEGKTSIYLAKVRVPQRNR